MCQNCGKMMQAQNEACKSCASRCLPKSRTRLYRFEEDAAFVSLPDAGFVLERVINSLIYSRVLPHLRSAESQVRAGKSLVTREWKGLDAVLNDREILATLSNASKSYRLNSIDRTNDVLQGFVSRKKRQEPAVAGDLKERSFTTGTWSKSKGDAGKSAGSGQKSNLRDLQTRSNGSLKENLGIDIDQELQVSAGHIKEMQQPEHPLVESAQEEAPYDAMAYFESEQEDSNLCEWSESANDFVPAELQGSASGDAGEERPVLEVIQEILADETAAGDSRDLISPQSFEGGQMEEFPLSENQREETIDHGHDPILLEETKSDEGPWAAVAESGAGLTGTDVAETDMRSLSDKNVPECVPEFSPAAGDVPGPLESSLGTANDEVEVIQGRVQENQAVPDGPPIGEQKVAEEEPDLGSDRGQESSTLGTVDITTPGAGSNSSVLEVPASAALNSARKPKERTATEKSAAKLKAPTGLKSMIFVGLAACLFIGFPAIFLMGLLKNLTGDAQQAPSVVTASPDLNQKSISDNDSLFAVADNSSKLEGGKTLASQTPSNMTPPNSVPAVSQTPSNMTPPNPVPAVSQTPSGAVPSKAVPVAGRAPATTDPVSVASQAQSSVTQSNPLPEGKPPLPKTLDPKQVVMAGMQNTPGSTDSSKKSAGSQKDNKVKPKKPNENTLSGIWSLDYKNASGTIGRGKCELLQEKTRLRGLGEDEYGMYRITGTVSGKKVNFQKVYLQNGQVVGSPIPYTGKISKGKNGLPRIDGTWQTSRKEGYNTLARTVTYSYAFRGLMLQAASQSTSPSD